LCIDGCSWVDVFVFLQNKGCAAQCRQKKKVRYFFSLIPIRGKSQEKRISLVGKNMPLPKNFLWRLGFSWPELPLGASDFPSHSLQDDHPSPLLHLRKGDWKQVGFVHQFAGTRI
jgi:hypothetical protein